METKYDIIINFLLNHWFIAVIVVIVVIIMALPQIRDGLKMLFRGSKQNKEFKSEYADETITFDVKLRSQDFDVVKIHATTHDLGVRAEKEWLNKFYPDYENYFQMLKHFATKDGKTLDFDVLTIRSGEKAKEIYFDITDFYEGAHVSFTNDISKYAEHKIIELYDK